VLVLVLVLVLEEVAEWPSGQVARCGDLRSPKAEEKGSGTRDEG
jgi:hypothetical protein